LTIWKSWLEFPFEDNTIGKKLQRLLPNSNALVVVSKGMWAVKLCTNKILQFLTGVAG